jgi:hypothetical protein
MGFPPDEKQTTTGKQWIAINTEIVVARLHPLVDESQQELPIGFIEEW